MINFALAREIYGLNPWFVDQQSLPSLIGMFEGLQRGMELEKPEIKYNTPHVLDISSEDRIITRPFQLNNSDTFRGIGIINIDGPITVSGGASSIGMRGVSEIMQQLALDERIVAFIVVTDSGGGASLAVRIMTDTINEIKKTKPVIGLIKSGGIAASAAYGILSATNAIFAESEMSIVGSAGTMIQFSGRKANSESPDGVKFIRLYAAESTEKNKGFEEALNNDNYEILYDQFLKPINDDFLKGILANRPVLAGTDFRNGNTKFAKESVGTFIDGIKTLSEVIEMALGNSADFKFKRTGIAPKIVNNNLITKMMTISELKKEHPALYASIFASGEAAGVLKATTKATAAEKDRVGAWMAHVKTDVKAVLEGIKSGLPISATQREEFLVKGASLAHLENLQGDSVEDVNSPEAKAKAEADAARAEELEFYGDIDGKLNPTKQD